MDCYRPLIALAERVVTAERLLREGPLHSAHSRVEEVSHSLERGSGLNSLGEFQGTAVAVDVAVSRLEEAAKCFSIAWHYLADDLEQDDDYGPWLDQVIAQSPRLTAIVKKAAAK